jgi:tripartite-type tricarboxylate transporter receptor subunit TctC
MTPLGWAGEKAYPGRPINRIAPYGQGGNADLDGKVAADKMAEF